MPDRLSGNRATTLIPVSHNLELWAEWFYVLSTMSAMHRIVIWGLMLLVGVPALSQDIIYGVRGGYLHVMSTSAIPVIAGASDCGSFANGTSPGFYGGLTFDVPIVHQLFDVGIGLMYSQRPAQLRTTVSTGFEVLDPTTNAYVPLVREHVFTSSLGYVAIEAAIRSQPLPEIPVFLRVAIDAGNPIVDATYTQTDEIVSPTGVLFPDGTKRRTTGSGEFPGLGTALGVTGGIGGAFMVSQTLEVCPEVFYRYGLGSITSSAQWEQSFIGGGIALRIHQAPDEVLPEPPQPEPEPAPIVEAPPAPVERAPAIIAAVRSAPLEIRETVVTQTFPLLPYVFFDSASAGLRATYQAAPPVAEFRELDLPKQTLPIYYNVLDILGSRMKARPDAVLTVTGTTDGIEATSAGAQKLAEQRAASVVSYIRQRWGIAADRFRQRTTDVPSLVSNPAYAEGIEENRRVELSTSTAGLLDPVVHTRFNEYLPVQPRHDVTIDVMHPDRATSWELRVRHRDRRVGSHGGNGAPPSSITFDLTQEMTDDLGPVVGTVDSLDVELVVSQREGNPVTASTRFPLIKTISNFEVSRLSLIVFDYNRSDISDQNKDMMRRVISASAGKGSTATIIGSTDRLGEMGYNLELSGARARSVQAYVRSIAPTLEITQVKGIGASSLPYSNDVPEGRFYCRTVSLTITTPLRGR